MSVQITAGLTGESTSMNTGQPSTSPVQSVVILLGRLWQWITKTPKRRKSRHNVEQVTWNDDGTMTLVIRGHVEPVRNGDYVIYVKRK